MALRFQSPEYFSLMVLGLVASIVLAQGSLIKALGMVVLGLLLGLVGTDVTSGTARFAFGLPELADGINFVIVAMGVFGVAEIVRNLENERTRQAYVAGIGRLLPSREDMGRIVAPILRGTGIGALLGILPGGGALLASFAAYALEKKVSPRGAEFGTGAIEGVAAPEAANNAGAQTSFIPDADARHSVKPGDGADDRRLDHPGHPARPQRHGRAAQAVLGRDRLDVGGKPVSAGAEPADDRPVGAAAHRPLSPALSRSSWCSPRWAC